MADFPIMAGRLIERADRGNVKNPSIKSLMDWSKVGESSPLKQPEWRGEGWG